MNMEHLDMQTPDGNKLNLDALYKICPSCFTEAADEKGKLRRVVDWTKLRALLGGDVVEDAPEAYDFTWVGKRAAQREAAAPIKKTLRPCPEESVDWENTQNLYIEGDNLEVLKLLQNSYMGKVKMIYIDPPYNTGNDFVYHDDRKLSEGDYDEAISNEEGQRFIKNTYSNGAFHSDWCSMMYARLMVSRTLMKDDGVIFISIDDNEVKNLKNICDEVFGENNFLGIITWSKKRKGSFLTKGIISLTEYLLVYTKNITDFKGLYGGKADESESQPIIKRTNRVSTLTIPANLVKSKLKDGTYAKGIYGDDVNPVELLDDVIIENGSIITPFRITAPFTWSQEMFDNEIKKGTRPVINTTNFQIRVFRVYDDDNFKGLGSHVNGIEIKGTNEDAYEELERIFGVKKLFDYSKPVNYLAVLIEAATHFEEEAIILDFFSGSASTAQATMQINKDHQGKRKFIMVQLPEQTENESAAKKAGYDNICEIGKKRIRLIGEEYKKGSSYIDTGFRVFKCDESNMKDVYFAPKDLTQDLLSGLEDNIKDDRTDLDLLFDCMLRWGVELSMPVASKKVGACTIHNVNDGDLVACFDGIITDEVINAIAEMSPLRVVFRDSSFKEASDKMNLFELFKQKCNWSDVEVRNNVRVI